MGDDSRAASRIRVAAERSILWRSTCRLKRLVARLSRNSGENSGAGLLRWIRHRRRSHGDSETILVDLSESLFTRSLVSGTRASSTRLGRWWSESTLERVATSVTRTARQSLETDVARRVLGVLTPPKQTEDTPVESHSDGE